MLQKFTDYCTRENAERLAKKNIEVTTVAFISLVIILVNVIL